MAFQIRKFIDCSLNDVFFDTLREDYPGFDKWFGEKSDSGAVAHVYLEEGAIQAFMYVKDYECEPVGDMPESSRMKIGTLKVCEDVARRRIAEGAIGIALWKWQRSDLNEIYITVLPKHRLTVELLESFGFVHKGKKGEENVYLKDKNSLNHTDAKKLFPYLNPNYSRGRYIPIDDKYHDQMFQYSDLKNTQQVREDFPVSNGITKNYIATPSSGLRHAPGDIAFIYRIHNGPGSKKHRSVVTSYCTITKVIPIRVAGWKLKKYDEFISVAGNKTVFTPEELKKAYTKSNVYVIEMVYNGYFGEGKNITFDALSSLGLFDKHPYGIEIDRKNVLKILEMGGKCEHDIVVDQSRAR